VKGPALFGICFVLFSVFAFPFLQDWAHIRDRLICYWMLGHYPFGNIRKRYDSKSKRNRTSFTLQYVPSFWLRGVILSNYPRKHGWESGLCGMREGQWGNVTGVESSIPVNIQPVGIAACWAGMSVPLVCRLGGTWRSICQLPILSTLVWR
jgi:hypothetical protein